MSTSEEEAASGLLEDRTNVTEIGNNLQHKTILLDHLNLITKFSGNDPNVLFADFMSSFLGIAKFLAWDDNDKIFALKTRLTGEAARLIKNQPETRTFDELKKTLEERFTKVESPTAALQKFLAFKQPPGMKVKDFFERASDLSYKALTYDGCDKQVAEKSRLAILKAMLLKNLAPEIRQGVVASDPKDPEEILRFALREEKGWESVRETDNFSDVLPPNATAPRPQNFSYACTNERSDHRSNMDISRDVEIEFLKRQVKSLEIQLKELKDSRRVRSQNNSLPVQCYVCDGWNHLARNCPNKNIGYNYVPRNIRGRNNRFHRGNRMRGGRPQNHEARERNVESTPPVAPYPQSGPSGVNTNSGNTSIPANSTNVAAHSLNMEGPRQN